MRQRQTLATKLSPPFDLILRYFISALIFYLIFFIYLLESYQILEGYFLTFKVIFLVHMFFLGFVLNTMFGAMYQLIPVALEKPIFSIFLAKFQFFIYEPGVILMLLGFYDNNIYCLTIGSFLVFMSILTFIFNFFMSLKTLKPSNIAAKFLIVSNIMLLFGAVIGLTMVLNMMFSFMPMDYLSLVFMHVIFMVFGFVFMSIMGLSNVLLPMFSLAHKYNDKFINMSFYVSLIGVFGFEVLFKFYIAKIFFLAFIFTGVCLYLIQVYDIYIHKPKGRDDLYIKGMFYSNVFIIFSFMAMLYSPIMFAIILTLGFFQMFILSNLYKIVPFLIWFHRFSPLVGKRKVPMLSEMMPGKIPKIQFIFSSVGLLVMVFSIILKTKILYFLGSFFLLIGALLFIFNIIYALRLK